MASLHIGIVAGEQSGDLLGAGLITALRRRYPHCEFSGIGGERMLAAGFDSLFPLERLAVMGLVEPLKRLPELLRIRAGLYRHFLAKQPAVMIGIDAPDFNLQLELKLRRQGIRTAHYVSPSVWAWRQGRIRKIRRAVDLMLTLFPFEAAFYAEHDVPVAFVGHPLADELPLEVDQQQARQTLGIDSTVPLLAVLPGSRAAEVAQLGELFLRSVCLCRQTLAGLQVLLPAANPARKAQLEALLLRGGQQGWLSVEHAAGIRILDGQSHAAMAAADAVLMASGTATLEALMLKKPMVVAYKMAPLSYFIMSRLLHAPYVALPNLLADAPLVPELLQHAAQPEALASALLQELQDKDYAQAMVARFGDIHRSLRRDASQGAADALSALIEQ